MKPIPKLVRMLASNHFIFDEECTRQKWIEAMIENEHVVAPILRVKTERGVGITIGFGEELRRNHWIDNKAMQSGTMFEE